MNNVKFSLCTSDCMSDIFLPPGAGQVQIGPVGRGGGPLHAESD